MFSLVRYFFRNWGFLAIPHTVSINEGKGLQGSSNIVPFSTLNLGNKGHWNLAQLVLTLILLTILTSFDPKPDPYFQP